MDKKNPSDTRRTGIELRVCHRRSERAFCYFYPPSGPEHRSEVGEVLLTKKYCFRDKKKKSLSRAYGARTHPISNVATVTDAQVVACKKNNNNNDNDDDNSRVKFACKTRTLSTRLRVCVCVCVIHSDVAYYDGTDTRCARCIHIYYIRVHTAIRHRICFVFIHTAAPIRLIRVIYVYKYK